MPGFLQMQQQLLLPKEPGSRCYYI